MSAHSIAANFDALTKALKSFHIASSRYAPGETTLHIVSMPDGRFFYADDYDLKSLRSGWTPDDLELCECGDSFPEDD